MKIAVTASGDTLESKVDPRFGRARWFLIVDTESGEHEAIDNLSSVEAASGAGVQSAQRVVDSGAEYLITGRCGPNAARALENGGIKVIEGVGGTVMDAIDAIKKGGLLETASGDQE
jgi:predicted Fe-Mo cluster-binding NifX family protein